MLFPKYSVSTEYVTQNSEGKIIYENHKFNYYGNGYGIFDAELIRVSADYEVPVK